jgi:hypothetical protein
MTLDRRLTAADASSGDATHEGRTHGMQGFRCGGRICPRRSGRRGPGRRALGDVRKTDEVSNSASGSVWPFEGLLRRLTPARNPGARAARIERAGNVEVVGCGDLARLTFCTGEVQDSCTARLARELRAVASDDEADPHTRSLQRHRPFGSFPYRAAQRHRHRHGLRAEIHRPQWRRRSFDSPLITCLSPGQRSGMTPERRASDSAFVRVEP